jgi:hypothetical protein
MESAMMRAMLPVWKSNFTAAPDCVCSMAWRLTKVSDNLTHMLISTLDVAQNQEEGTFGSFAEVVPKYGCLNIRVLVDEFHALLDAPPASNDRVAKPIDVRSRGASTLSRPRRRSHEDAVFPKFKLRN